MTLGQRDNVHDRLTDQDTVVVHLARRAAAMDGEAGLDHGQVHLEAGRTGTAQQCQRTRRQQCQHVQCQHVCIVCMLSIPSVYTLSTTMSLIHCKNLNIYISII